MGAHPPHTGWGGVRKQLGCLCYCNDGFDLGLLNEERKALTGQFLGTSTLTLN